MVELPGPFRSIPMRSILSDLRDYWGVMVDFEPELHDYETAAAFDLSARGLWLNPMIPLWQFKCVALDVMCAIKYFSYDEIHSFPNAAPLPIRRMLRTTEHARVMPLYPEIHF